MAPVAYLALADELEREFRRAKPGSRLPSEHELAARHLVSRITTRTALQELERRHLVTRRRGAGTFVALRVDYPISAATPPSFTATIRGAGHEPGSRVLSVRSGQPPARVRDALGLTGGVGAVQVRRIGTIDGEPATVQTTWIAHVDAKLIKAGTVDGVSMFDLLRAASFVPVRVRSSAELDTMPAAAAAMLRLEGRPQGWLLISTNRCARRDQMIEYSESWVRADMVRVRFELGADTTSDTDPRTDVHDRRPHTNA